MSSSDNNNPNLSNESTSGSSDDAESSVSGSRRASVIAATPDIINSGVLLQRRPTRQNSGRIHPEDVQNNITQSMKSPPSLIRRLSRMGSTRSNSSGAKRPGFIDEESSKQKTSRKLQQRERMRGKQIPSMFTYKPPVERSGVNIWLRQFEAIFIKNFVQFRYGYLTILIVALLLPAITVFIAAGFSGIIRTTLSKSVFPNQIILDGSEPVYVDEIPRCPKNAFYCNPVIYFAPNDLYHTIIAKRFSEMAGIKYNEDVIPFSSKDEMIDAYYRDLKRLQRRPRHYMLHFATFENITRVPQTWPEIQEHLARLPATYYTFGEGSTNLVGSFFDPFLKKDYSVVKSTLLVLSGILDRAIISVRSGKAVRSKISLATFPKYLPPNITIGRSVAAEQLQLQKMQDLLFDSATNIHAAFILAFGVFPLFLLVLGLLNEDKFNGMLKRLRQMNLYESAYWAAMFATVIVLCLISSAIALIAQAIVSYPPVSNTTPGVFFVILFLYSVSFICFGMFCVSITGTQFASGILSVIFMVFSVLFLFIMPVLDVTQIIEKSSIVHWWRAWSTGSYVLLSLLPFLPFGRAIGFLAYLSKWEKSISWSVASSNFNPENTPNQSEVLPLCILMQILLIPISFIAHCYFNQITGPHPKGFLFFIRNFRSPRSNFSDSKETVASVSDITQRFGKVVVLKGVSLRLLKGQITALLGHNGSGKSTLIDIFSGVESQKSGTGHIGGYAIGSGSSKQRLGICPQGDTYYHSVPAHEHMELWCRFKCIPRKRVSNYAQSMLATVNLAYNDVGNIGVGSFSGGMKRRLSLISACIAAPDLVIFDEPTNGLDPIHRRHIWDFVSVLKANAAVLLTSHSNLEVEALADDVIILSQGAVVLSRNLMELRQESALEIQIEFANEADISTIPVPVIEKINVTDTIARFKLTQENFVTLAEFLQSPKVLGWEKYSSMEGFLPAQPGTACDGELEHNSSSAASSTQSLTRNNSQNQLEARNEVTKRNRRYLLLHQILGILMKNIKIQWHQKRMNLVFMGLFIGVLIGFSLLASSSNKTICPSGTTRQAEGCSTNYYSDATKSYYKLCTAKTPYLCSMPDYFLMKQTNYSRFDEPPRIWIIANNDIQQIISNQNAKTILENTEADYEILKSQFNAPFLDITPSMLQRFPNITFLQNPLENVLLSIKSSQVEMSQKVTDIFSISPVCRTLAEFRGLTAEAASEEDAVATAKRDFPDFLLELNVDNSPSAYEIKLNLRYWAYTPYPFAAKLYTYRNESTNELGCHVVGANPSGRAKDPQFNDPGISELLKRYRGLGEWDDKVAYMEGIWLLDNVVRHGLHSAMNTAARMILGTSDTILPHFAAIWDPIFPFRSELILAALISILLWLFFPIYCAIPTAEYGKFLLFIRVNGLPMSAYWFAQYVYCQIYSAPFHLLLILVIKVMRTETNLGHLLLCIITSNHYIICIAFLFTTILLTLDMRAAAGFLGHLFPILVTLPAVIYTFADVLSIPAILTPGSFALPGVATCFALRQILQGSDEHMASSAYWLLIIYGLICFGTTIVINVIVENRYIWSMKLRGYMKKYFKTGKSDKKKRKSVAGPLQNPNQISKIDEVNVPNSIPYDNDLEKEKNHVYDSKVPKLLGIRNVRKTYGPECVILNGVTFMVGAKSSFGLLGSNGCGKSHLVNLITGQMRPTSGRIKGPPSWMIGLCPQDNFLIESLSVLDNLCFYAYLKGYGGKSAILESTRVANDVGLLEFKDRTIRRLSGGMKRRVSLAIALIGGPELLVADEPTTALDVHHQKNLWRIIRKLQKKRGMALLLVSHYMDEIEFLCKRMAILQGKLKCIGSGDSLKKKYGDAWRLLIQCPQDRAQNVRNWIPCLAPEVVEITMSVAMTFVASKVKMEFNISMAGAKLSEITSLLHQNAKTEGITEWSITPLSLEDVFVRVVTSQVANEPPPDDSEDEEEEEEEDGEEINSTASAAENWNVDPKKTPKKEVLQPKKTVSSGSRPM